MIPRIQCFYGVKLAALAVALAAVVIAAPANAKTMQDIAKAGTFNIGVIPYDVDIIRDPATGEYEGVFIEAIKHVCDRIEVKCVFKEFTWQTFVAGLQSRQIDLSIASTYSTMPRAMVVNFTRPIYNLGYKGIVRKDENRFDSVESLNDPDVKISVCQGCGQHEWAMRMAPKAQFRAVKTEEAAILEIATGRSDIAIGASAPVNHALATQPNLKLALGGKIYSSNQVAWAINKGDQDILNFMNVAIGQLISTGKLSELAKKYDAPWLSDLPN